jgi:uncharacterized protein HemX
MTLAPRPIRFYLILLFIAVAGIGMYLVYKQQNEDYDASLRQNALEAQSTPTPVSTADPQAGSSAPSSTSLQVETELAEIDKLLAEVSVDDFSDSNLSNSSLGF